MTQREERPDGIVVIRSRVWGWWVDGLWCPTRNIRDHCISRRREGEWRATWAFPLMVGMLTALLWGLLQ